MATLTDFTYGDARIDKLVLEFFNKIIERCSICIREIAGSRKKEVAFHRLIKNEKFTPDKIIEDSILKTRKNFLPQDIQHILCIQDTTELCFETGSKNTKVGMGPLTRSFCKGFFVHPGLLVDAKSYTILGISDIIHWTRTEKEHSKDENGKSIKDNKYKKLPIEDKESYRWIKLAENTKTRFPEAKITIIADRESDIYEEWDRIPDERVNMLTRVSRNRTLSNKSSLYNELDTLPPSFCYRIDLPSITGKRKARTAYVEVSYSSVEIMKPHNCKDKVAKERIVLNAILVREVNSDVEEKEKILWRLLTTHKVDSADCAKQVINWYTKRWLIEQLFRTIKKQGLNIEDSQIRNGDFLKKIAISAVIVSVKIMQLVQSRDGKNTRTYIDVFEEEDLEILSGLNKKLEGNTKKQKNPHMLESLAWACWIISRLGGWKGYESERAPGPITMKRGLEYFQQIKSGWQIAKDVCIR